MVNDITETAAPEKGTVVKICHTIKTILIIAEADKLECEAGVADTFFPHLTDDIRDAPFYAWILNGTTLPFAICKDENTGRLFGIYDTSIGKYLVKRVSHVAFFISFVWLLPVA
ncbi:hypothetical protein HG531_006679 [Fusarium graminearum]|nr:hypothetical protein HG531_006679 [Fusarium graminearum]